MQGRWMPGPSRRSRSSKHLSLTRSLPVLQALGAPHCRPHCGGARGHCVHLVEESRETRGHWRWMQGGS